MKRFRTFLIGGILLLALTLVLTQAGILLCQPAGSAKLGTGISLTIYNQNFAVVRNSVPMDLTSGTNDVKYADVTAHVEPDSVILRDPSGKWPLQILEQNYRSDPISQELLLSINEGKTIDFIVRNADGKEETVQGKIIRSGYVPHYGAWNRYGQQYAARQSAMVYQGGGTGQPIIEVNGKVRFGLPGLPIFPALPDETILKPTLQWTLESGKKGKLVAELSYVTGGMSWSADYNLVGEERSDVLDLIGWVTMDNQSGKTFNNAGIKLMAGDVAKERGREDYGARSESSGYMRAPQTPAVTEKAFDEFHLYTLQRPVTLHDRELKQVEFIRASGIKSRRIFIYDGAQIDWNQYRGYSGGVIYDERFGLQSNTKVWVMREFENAKKNNLGMPLPAGVMRFYTRDDDGSLQFVGESRIDHTPKDETVRVYTGNAFDLVGERKRTNFKVDNSAHWLDETFEIKVRNHKKEKVEVKIVEHLYRWVNWEITEKNSKFNKKDAQTIEFPIEIRADGEAVITYKVHYTW